MSARILIVDDDAVTRILLQAHLGARGFECDAVASGEEGLAILACGRIGVLVTDLQMPGMDGIALLRAVRSRGLITRCVVVTGYATIGNLTACLREGAVALVRKPFDEGFAALDRAVDQALAQMRQWADQMHAIVQSRPPQAAEPDGALEPRSGDAR